jgi:hypothetical protein
MTNSAGLGAAPGRPRSNEPTLDELLAEPIVQLLMRRDGINEATIRRLLQETAAVRPPVWAEDDLDTDDPTRSFGCCMRGSTVVQPPR